MGSLFQVFRQWVGCSRRSDSGKGRGTAWRTAGEKKAGKQEGER